jgi:DNA-binding CsgD family transcriptional regulator
MRRPAGSAREFEPVSDAGPVAEAAPAPADSRRWMRDLGALLALPALWVDHEPIEIADGLLSVLFGMLPIDAAYAHFDDPRGATVLETWRPMGPAVPRHLADAVATGDTSTPGMTTAEVRLDDGRVARVTSLPLALPWERARVIVSAPRAGFPSERDAHLLRVAVSQAAIAIHTSRRLAGEHAARMAAERALDIDRRTLRDLVGALGPELSALAAQVEAAGRALASHDPEPAPGAHEAPGSASPSAPVRSSTPTGDAPVSRIDMLTRRETEVLGLLAQGLSNKEIAGVMWISDRTIERHVTSIYRKIGVGRRSEATAFALRHGLA